MPLTAEGIRPAIYFGQQCGALLQLVLDEKLALAQAQSTYEQLHDSYRPYYRWLRQHQNWTTRLPATLLAAVMKLAKMMGQSERILRRYCAIMPITPASETECDVGDGRRLAPEFSAHASYAAANRDDERGP